MITDTQTSSLSSDTFKQAPWAFLQVLKTTFMFCCTSNTDKPSVKKKKKSKAQMAHSGMNRCPIAINGGINIYSYLQLLSETHRHVSLTHNACETLTAVWNACTVFVCELSATKLRRSSEAKLGGGCGSALSLPPETVMWHTADRHAHFLQAPKPRK